VISILQFHNLYQQPGGEDGVMRAERELLARTGHEQDLSHHQQEGATPPE